METVNINDRINKFIERIKKSPANYIKETYLKTPHTSLDDPELQQKKEIRMQRKINLSDNKLMYER